MGPQAGKALCCMWELYVRHPEQHLIANGNATDLNNVPHSAFAKLGKC